MPSYEQQDGSGLVVYDLLLSWPGTGITPPLFISRWYNSACILAPEGPVPLHHEVHQKTLALFDPIDERGGAGCLREITWSEGAKYQWRPIVYRLNLQGIGALGSQAELAWRRGLSDATQAHFADDQVEGFEVLSRLERADEKAERLLREHLNPQQLLELAADDKFRLYGARTGNLYEIELGDGFDLLDKVSSDTVASYCLHTEYWMPAADIALATKLALEDPELEIECLENARSGGIWRTRRRTSQDWKAYRLERELLSV